MAKINNKPAEAYAKPHTMSGKAVSGELPAESTESGIEYMNKMPVSVGNIGKPSNTEVKTSGIVVRGTSKQTKGKMARGPMA